MTSLGSDLGLGGCGPDLPALRGVFDASHPCGYSVHPWPGAETGVVLRVSWETRPRCPVQGDKSQAGTKKGKSGLE